jgi:hypothetical protein
MKNLITITSVALAWLLIAPAAAQTPGARVPANRPSMHNEKSEGTYIPSSSGERKTSPSYRYKSTGFTMTQVNVDGNGNNILGDAANEPSIAIDPVNPARMVIGWRQFDHVYSSFRQAGYGYTLDAGQTWTFPGVIDEGVFRSDPVLDCDSAGNFFYNSLNSDGSVFTCKVFKSEDGGASWGTGVPAFGGDKQWMVIDKSGGEGNGNIYSWWNAFYSSCSPGNFTRSDDFGATYQDCIDVEGYPYWGTMAIGPEGELYMAGTGGWDGIIVTKSSNAQTPGAIITWDFATWVDVDGYLTAQAPVNPVGLLGQASIGVDVSDGPGRGNVYVLSSVVRTSNGDPGDVMFARSTDGGETFEPYVRINDDPSSSNYQWFGTMSVAPNGRIDVVWLDTRESPAGLVMSALYYCYSTDQGENWSDNLLLSDAFDPTLGYPQQEKMGDYFQMISDNEGANLAWANTFNGEQDVYFSRIIPDITGIGENRDKSNGLTLEVYPNPFRDQATLRYTLGNASNVNLTVCDLYGKEILKLVDKTQAAGSYNLTIGKEKLPAGFYICTLSAGGHQKSVRLIRTN